MCAPCNHPFKCRYRRGVLTDECRADTGSQSRTGPGLKLQLLHQTASGAISVTVTSSFCLWARGGTESEQHQCSGNVTDWSSRWTVKIKRMTNKHAAYTAFGANPPPPPAGLPFEELPLRSTHRQWRTPTAKGRTHNLLMYNKCQLELMAGPQTICNSSPKTATQ